MSTSFVVDLHSLHILGFAHVGAQAVRDAFGRQPHPDDPFHFLHSASLLALAGRIHFADDQWTGPEFTPRSQLALRYVRDKGFSDFRSVGADPAERLAIAAAAGAALTNDLPSFCLPDALGSISARVPVGQGSFEEEATAATRRLMTTYAPEDERAVLQEKFLTYPNNTSLLMMTSTPQLYDAIHDRFWPSFRELTNSGAVINRLETLFRMYTYVSLPSRDGQRAWFSPAFDRVSKWERDGQTWASHTNRTPAAPARDDAPLIPGSVAALLLRRSGGDPETLLRLALTFRRDHARTIDECVPAALQAYSRRRDADLPTTLAGLASEIQAELRDDRLRLPQKLDDFLAANGLTLAGPTIATERERRALIKGDLTDADTRAILEGFDEFKTLASRIERGRTTVNKGGILSRADTIKRIEKDPLAQRLVSTIRSRSPIIVMGTGVTIFATGDARYTWQGVIESGLARVAEAPEHLELVEAMRGVLKEKSRTSLAFRLAGDVIREALHEDAWADWLRQLLKDPPRNHLDLVEAIVALANHCDVRIATTNYDTLFEEMSHRSYFPMTWSATDESEIQTFFSNERHDPASERHRNVFHLHGLYTRPETVVLGNWSYGQLGADRMFAYLERMYERPIIFVGFSSLDDPTFVRLREFKNAFKYGPEHFILFPDATAAGALREKGLPTPVGYGARHEDLPDFLQALRELASAKA